MQEYDHDHDDTCAAPLEVPDCNIQVKTGSQNKLLLSMHKDTCMKLSPSDVLVFASEP